MSCRARGRWNAPFLQKGERGEGEGGGGGGGGTRGEGGGGGGGGGLGCVFGNGLFGILPRCIQSTS